MRFKTKYGIKGNTIHCPQYWWRREDTQLIELTKKIKGYKVVKQDSKSFIITIEIPRGTVIHCPVDFKYNKHDRKCRAEWGIVTKIQEKVYPRWMSGSELKDSKRKVVINNRRFGEKARYELDGFVVPNNGFEYQRNTCAPGIHFFMDIQDAKRY